MGTRAWIMTADMAQAFFEQCLWREAVKEEERLAILQEMAEAHKIGVFDTNFTKEQLVEAMAKHCNVWKVSKDKRNV